MRGDLIILVILWLYTKTQTCMSPGRGQKVCGGWLGGDGPGGGGCVNLF